MPNGRKIDQTAINIQTISIERPYKIFPNWDFWFENIHHLATLLGIFDKVFQSMKREADLDEKVSWKSSRES
jgi:hypothetical protein